MARQSFDQSRSVISILVENDGKLELNEDGLRRIFLNPKLSGKRLCIISISGAFRKGKSFMLNFFLRHLRNEGHTNETWMGREDDKFDDGFKWKGGRQACTNGIMIWNELFFTKKDGDEIAILLMDTQGLFDGRMDRANNSIIFALSTLLSSVQIYNLSHQIQDNNLEYLQFFTDYTRAAQEEQFDAGVKPFQTLTFLIRDWPHAVELNYGMDGGEGHLQEVLSDDSRSQEVRAIKEHLLRSFETTRCCLLPYPGRKVAETHKESFCLCLQEVEMEFRLETAQFVNEMLHPRNLVVKCINGRPAESRAIMKYISDCANNMTNGKLPTPRNMIEITAEARNLEAQQACLEMYSRKLTEVMGKHFMADDLLLAVHTEAAKACNERYREMTRLGGEESRRKHQQHLKELIDREFRTIRELNEARMAAAELSLANLVESLSKIYEDNMNEIVEDKEYLDETELESWHTAFTVNALNKFDDGVLSGHPISTNYRKQLGDRMERSHRRIQTDNNEKREIAEEQDRTKQTLQRNRIEIVLSFRQYVSQKAQEYMDKIELRQLCETEKRNLLDRFNIQLMEKRIPETVRRREEEQLRDKLTDEIETFSEINEEKEARLLKYLESERMEIAVQYEHQFSTILKAGYIEKQDLRDQHKEIVERLMTDQRENFRPSQLSQDPVRDHLTKTKNTLEGKYEDIERQNEHNYSIWGRIFKAVKDNGPRAAKIASKLLSLISIGTRMAEN